jgi:hypothetical protein
MIKLKCGDVILSYKKAPKWNLVQQFFDRKIENKAYSKYGHYCKFAHANHVRIYLGKDRYGKEWAFEYTFPTAKFTEFQPWMVDPNYGQVYRTKKDYIIDGNEMFSICIGQAGSLYDLGQLFDMWLGFNRFFDFGRSNRVCSTGVRWLLEEVIRVNLFPDISLNKTLPCTFANSNEFERIAFALIERK